MDDKYRVLIKTKAPELIEFMMLWCDKAKILDCLAPLALRLYLVPVLWMAGSKKISGFSDTVEWFGNETWGLGLPLPYVLVTLVALLEIVGALCLLVGFGVRLISIPLMIIMIIAAVTVHLQNGWLAIATAGGFFANERTLGAIERLERAQEVLKTMGNYDWLTEHGSFVILNNGIEFAVTYFIMLLVLFFMGAGRYVSIDYWLKQQYKGK
jgi:uncharacterized membrane protein YphA (DoxX/SURF4 family)